MSEIQEYLQKQPSGRELGLENSSGLVDIHIPRQEKYWSLGLKEDVEHIMVQQRTCIESKLVIRKAITGFEISRAVHGQCSELSGDIHRR